MSSRTTSRNCCYYCVEDYMVYTTTKELRVKNKFIGAINICGILLIFTYVVIYTIIIHKGYQLVALPTGYVSTKTKGLAFNTSDEYDMWSFFESVDLVQPAAEIDGLFITTSLVQTWQSRDICDGEDECETDDDCIADDYDNNGVNTGECRDGWCQQYRYCPPENDTVTITNKLIGVENFTIFLKVVLEFNEFEHTMMNTRDIHGTGGLVESYNLFTLSDILDECDLDIDDIIEDGVLLKGRIHYNCDFDKDEPCKYYPKFRWHEEEAPIDTVSTGYNFRKTYFSLNSNTGTTDRLLVKYHGIRIWFAITGQGGQFDIKALTMAVGSGLALTAISAFVTEFILRHCIAERSFYADRRMEIVSMDEAKDWERTQTIKPELCGESRKETSQDPSSWSESLSLQKIRKSANWKPSAHRVSDKPEGLRVRW